MNKRLQDLLLEFDPRQSSSRAVFTKRGRRALASKVAGNSAVGGEMERSKKGHGTTEFKKDAKKARYRAMNRGTPLKGAGPKGKLPEAIEQALLEFDPKHKATTLATAKIVGRAQFAADRERFRTDKSSEKVIKKVKHRALARGAKTTKSSGPKGKLPEAIEQALLEYDPGKDKDIKSKQLVGRAFNREAKKGDFRRANKAKNRQVARGSGDVLGSGKNKLVRKDIARDIRNLNRKTKAKLGEAGIFVGSHRKNQRTKKGVLTYDSPKNKGAQRASDKEITAEEKRVKAKARRSFGTLKNSTRAANRGVGGGDALANKSPRRN